MIKKVWVRPPDPEGTLISDLLLIFWFQATSLLYSTRHFGLIVQLIKLFKNFIGLSFLLRMFDLDGSGRISKSEIRDVLRSLGHNPNEDQINLLIAQVPNRQTCFICYLFSNSVWSGKVDVDGNGTLDLSEFMEFMNSHFCSWTPASDLKCVFRLLDPQVKKYRSFLAKNVTQSNQTIQGSGLVRVSKIRDMILRYSYGKIVWFHLKGGHRVLLNVADFDESEVDEMVGELGDDDTVDFERFSELVAGTRTDKWSLNLMKDLNR